MAELHLVYFCLKGYQLFRFPSSVWSIAFGDPIGDGKSVVSQRLTRVTTPVSAGISSRGAVR
jgi:hypothetical protein